MVILSKRAPFFVSPKIWRLPGRALPGKRAPSYKSRRYPQKGRRHQITPGRRKSGALFHVPLHGTWSDYTGFTEDRRSQYYENVRAIAMEYGIEMLDLTGYEYEPYFMCDTMHLGWKGWLAVDRAFIDFYYDR